MDLVEALLGWYAPRRRAYPWRRSRPDPYRVLVSEVMLQQTQAPRVVPAFRAFLDVFPTVEALAAAPRSEVVRAWDGLGYNRRAVALSEAALAIVREHGGRVPRDPGVLRRLPGVGPYTAAAVASLAFGVAIPAVDTNVRRVVARIGLGLEPQEASPGAIATEAERLMDRGDPGGWNQALMDLGREVCRPVPRCGVCPLASGCRFRGSGRPGGPRARSTSHATGRGRRQPPFEGSFRQVRGAVVRALRRRDARTLGSLAEEIGEPLGRVCEAVSALARDGMVRAGPAALGGRSQGRVRLAP